MPSTKDLTAHTKFAYWVGQVAEGQKGAIFALFLLFYYNQVLGLSGSLCGLALLIAMAVDAITDPLMGSITDRWRSRWGRRHPFMYAAAVPMAIAVYFTFDPWVDSQAGLFVWLLVFGIAARMLMTLYSVPHMALGAEMTNDYQERTVVVAGRSLFGYLGQFLVYFFGFAVFFASSAEFENGQLNSAAYPPFALLMGAIMIVSIIYSAAGTHHLIPRLQRPEKPQEHPVKQLLLDTGEALRNPSFRWIAVGFIVVAGPVGTGMAFALYMNTFFWEVPPEGMTYILLATPVGTAIGYLFAPLLAPYLEKRQSLILGALGWAVFAVAPVCLHYAGFFPAPGTTGVVVGLSVFAFLAGLVVSQVGVAVGSILGDVSDEQELVNGKRQEGVFYGAYAFVNKATGGIGSAFSGFILDLIDWPRGQHVQSAADIPPDALFALAMVAGPGLALGFIPAVWCFMHYRLDRDKHRAIVAELDARRTAADGVSVATAGPT